LNQSAIYSPVLDGPASIIIIMSSTKTNQDSLVETQPLPDLPYLSAAKLKLRWLEAKLTTTTTTTIAILVFIVLATTTLPAQAASLLRVCVGEKLVFTPTL
jgi:hypothetical protein